LCNAVVDIALYPVRQILAFYFLMIPYVIEQAEYLDGEHRAHLLNVVAVESDIENVLKNAVGKAALEKKSVLRQITAYQLVDYGTVEADEKLVPAVLALGVVAVVAALGYHEYVALFRVQNLSVYFERAVPVGDVLERRDIAVSAFDAVFLVAERLADKMYAQRTLTVVLKKLDVFVHCDFSRPCR